MPIDLRDGKIKNARALFYKIENGSPLFLLTQEASSGAYTIPGGCKDADDVDLRAALERELREDLEISSRSYTVSDPGITKQYEDLYDRPAERKGKPTLMSLFLVRYEGGDEIRAGDGIASIGWFSETDAVEKLHAAHMKEFFLLGAEKIKQSL